jgi:hypothetical protein
MNSSFLRNSIAVAGAVTIALLTGCATQLGSPAASADNTTKARATGMGAVQVGEFALSPGKDKSLDSSISVRATSLSAPTGGSFSQYLRETLIVELKSAGLLNPTSPAVITGFLTESQVDPAMSEGSGKLSARFMVTRAGSTVYDRELSVSSKWPSSFVGAVAIPAAINEYTTLYRKLVGALLDDPKFQEVTRK